MPLVGSLLRSRLARPQPLSPGIQAEPTGREAAVTALPWRVLVLEMGSALLWTGRRLATKRRAARAASRAPLPGGEAAQQGLAALAPEYGLRTAEIKESVPPDAVWMGVEYLIATGWVRA